MLEGRHDSEVVTVPSSPTPASTPAERDRIVDEVLDLLAEAVLKDTREQNGRNPTGVEPTPGES